jgi:hypothetical protein
MLKKKFFSHWSISYFPLGLVLPVGSKNRYVDNGWDIIRGDGRNSTVQLLLQISLKVVFLCSSGLCSAYRQNTLFH